jgi:hypothetical protein
MHWLCEKSREREGEEQDDILEVEEGGLAEVEHFCYLGDVLHCEAGLERTVRVRVAAAWSSWREVSSLLVNGGIPVNSSSRVYVACVRLVRVKCKVY